MFVHLSNKAEAYAKDIVARYAQKNIAVGLCIFAITSPSKNFSFAMSALEDNWCSARFRSPPPPTSTQEKNVFVQLLSLHHWLTHSLRGQPSRIILLCRGMALDEYTHHSLCVVFVKIIINSRLVHHLRLIVWNLPWQVNFTWILTEPPQTHVRSSWMR